MKKQWPIILLGIIVVLVLVPLGIAFMLSFRLIVTDTTNEWIGFWGGYLGSILGGVITLIVMWYTLKNENQNRRREEKIYFFDNIISLSAEYFQMCARMTEVMTLCFDNITSESYTIAINKANAAEKIRIQIRMLLETRENVYEVKEMLEVLENTEKKIDGIMKVFDDICKVNAINKKEQIAQYREMTDNLFKDFIDAEKIIKVAIKENMKDS